MASVPSGNQPPIGKVQNAPASSSKAVSKLRQFKAVMFTKSLKENETTKAVVAGRIVAGIVKLAAAGAVGFFLAPVVPLTAAIAVAGGTGLIVASVMCSALVGLGLMTKNPLAAVGLGLLPWAGFACVALSPMVPTVALAAWAVADFCVAANDIERMQSSHDAAKNIERMKRAEMHATNLRSTDAPIYMDENGNLLMVQDRRWVRVTIPEHIDNVTYTTNLEKMKEKIERAKSLVQDLEKDHTFPRGKIIEQGGQLFLKKSPTSVTPLPFPDDIKPFDVWKKWLKIQFA